MLRPVIGVFVVSLISAGTALGWVDEKSDVDTKVPAGTEFKLVPVEVILSSKPNKNGIYEATIKPAKEATLVKMPGQAWTLGFSATIAKGGVEVTKLSGKSELIKLRRTAGKREEGDWQVDPGDIITHINGYAVSSVEDVICAVSLAKDKTDIQLVLEDADTDKLLVFS